MTKLLSIVLLFIMIGVSCFSQSAKVYRLSSADALNARAQYELYISSKKAWEKTKSSLEKSLSSGKCLEFSETFEFAVPCSDASSIDKLIMELYDGEARYLSPDEALQKYQFRDSTPTI